MTRHANGLGLDRWLVDDEVARWADGFARKIADGRPIPAYGSTDWAAADWQLQVAAAVLAGEAHRREGLHLEQHLRDELAAARYLAELDDSMEFADVAAGVRAMASTPTHSELEHRRAAVRRPATPPPTNPWPTPADEQAGAA